MSKQFAYANQPKARRDAAEDVLSSLARTARNGPLDCPVSKGSLGVFAERFFNMLFFAKGEPSVDGRAWEELNALLSNQEAEIKALRARIIDFTEKLGAKMAPIPMRLTCPSCKALHVDEGKFATHPHHSHACQTCGNVWRPAIVNTVGVRFLPGFKDHAEDGGDE